MWSTDCVFEGHVSLLFVAATTVLLLLFRPQYSYYPAIQQRKIADMEYLSRDGYGPAAYVCWPRGYMGVKAYAAQMYSSSGARC